MTDDRSWMHWSRWTTSAYGGRFVAWSQHVCSYCCFVDPYGVFVRLEDIPPKALEELNERYFEPMDDDEEAAFDRIKDNKHVTEAQRQAAINRLVQAIAGEQKRNC